MRFDWSHTCLTLENLPHLKLLSHETSRKHQNLASLAMEANLTWGKQGAWSQDNHSDLYSPVPVAHY